MWSGVTGDLRLLKCVSEVILYCFIFLYFLPLLTVQNEMAHLERFILKF